MANTKSFLKKKKTLNCGGKIIDLSVPKIMGILNVTPDSFFDGGIYKDEASILKKTEKMLTEGAAIIDIGAYSSRPGAENISEKEEINRLETVLKAIRKEFSDIIISVDTFRSKAADYVIEEFGVNIINDISAGGIYPEILDVVKKHNVPYILMHMQGVPQTMQLNPQYKNITLDIIDFFAKKVDGLGELGVHDIILDPGFGFGKTIEHNFALLKNLNQFEIFELPILVGLSRKSMIYKTLDTSAEEALNGTIALNTLALNNGADILRVHDVKEAVEVVRLVEKYKEM